MEALRSLKRRLSDVVVRAVLADERAPTTGSRLTEEQATIPFLASRALVPAGLATPEQLLLGGGRRCVAEEMLMHFSGQFVGRASELRVLNEKLVHVSVVPIGLRLLKRCLPVLADHHEG
jgi:hypothetical protein